MPRVFLHIGVPKTGTTFLQTVLWRDRDVALRQGLLLPLEGVGDHYRACLDLTARANRARAPERVPGSWARLVEAIAAHDGDALVSHEMFALATADQAAHALRDLAATGREVHVVVTVRDLARQLPSLWQETVKAARPWTMSEFLGELRDGTGSGRDPARILDYPGLVADWSQGLLPERVHLVTVPPPGAGRALLWERFCATVGLTADAFSLDVPDANDSLGAAQVEVLRRVNAELAGRVSWPMPYTTTVKRGLAHAVLAGRGGGRIAVPASELPWVSAQATASVERLAASGADVVGELAELLVPDAGPTTSDGPTQEEVTSEAIAAVAALLAAQARTDQRMAEPAQDIPAPEGSVRRTAARIARRFRHG